MAEFSVPGYNNTVSSISIPVSDLSDKVGNIYVAKDLAEQEKDYIVDNNMTLFGRAENPLSIDKDLAQFELNNNPQKDVSLTNAPQISAWLDGRKNVRETDYTRILFPSQDVTENYIDMVVKSQENLAREILSIPFHTRAAMESMDRFSTTRDVVNRRHFDINP